MSSGSENNALVEIALALSMAFFSLMVLTMVSMSAGSSGKVQMERDVTVNSNGLVLKKAQANPKASAAGSKTQAVKPEKLAVYYQEKLYDAALNPLAAAQLQARKIKFLAVAPDLSMAKAIRVRDRFGGHGLIVTTLNEAWLKTLKEKVK